MREVLYQCVCDTCSTDFIPHKPKYTKPSAAPSVSPSSSIVATLALRPRTSECTTIC
jgi:hypothetical protein